MNELDARISRTALKNKVKSLLRPTDDELVVQMAIAIVREEIQDHDDTGILGRVKNFDVEDLRHDVMADRLMAMAKIG